MKIIMKQNQSTETAAQIQMPHFEVVLPVVPTHQVSARATQTRSTKSPVERHTVMQAAALLREVMIMVPATTVRTQANIRKEKAAVLLAE